MSGQSMASNGSRRAEAYSVRTRTLHLSDDLQWAMGISKKPRPRVSKTSPPPLKDESPAGGRCRPDPHQNHLLDALPSGDYERVASHLELLPMKLGDVLYESGAHLR